MAAKKTDQPKMRLQVAPDSRPMTTNDICKILFGMSEDDLVQKIVADSKKRMQATGQ